MSTSSTPLLERAACCLTFASAVSIIFSIATSQTLLGLAFAALLMSGAPMRWLPLWLPLSVFLGGTLVSLAFSGNAAAGLPQLRKMFVFLILLVVASSLRDRVLIRRLFLCWFGIGAVVAVRGLVQFVDKWQQAHALGRNFYDYYVVERITGFMSHWMTFGGQEMTVLLMLMAYLFFSPSARKRGLWLWLLCGAILSAALILGFTRSIWLASLVAGSYLIWFWRRWVLLAAPVALLLLGLVSPPSVRARFSSLFQPRKDIDSNEHRVVTWRTGLHMIHAHPWLGLGPEGPNLHFKEYVPADVPRPLPSGWYGHLHNIYLQYAAERGIPVMLVMLWILGHIFWDFGRGLRRLPPGPHESRWLLHGGIAVVMATMISGVFEYNLGDSEVLTMFLIVVACGYLALDLPADTEEAAHAG